MLYGWRVLPGTPPADVGLSSSDGIEATVARWDGSAAVRRRVEAMGRARANLVLFCEYIPHRLSDWLAASDLYAGASAFLAVDAQLAAGLEFMAARGFIHFDVHFNNVLTDTERCYFADFGLATSDRFELTEAERAFCAGHRTYDQACAITSLVCAMVEGIRGAVPRRTFLSDWTDGDGALSPQASAMISRYAPRALLLMDFHARLLAGPKTVPFPG